MEDIHLLPHKPTSLLVRLHVTASSDRMLIASSPNLMKYRETWRTAQRLLHSKHKTVYNDAECAKLVSTFCQFFAEKLNRISDSILDALASSARRVFTVRPHQGSELSSFQSVTVDEVRRLLSSMPSKSSPLDVLPCTLLKSCDDVFAPVIATLANLSLQSGKFPSCCKKLKSYHCWRSPG